MDDSPITNAIAFTSIVVLLGVVLIVKASNDMRQSGAFLFLGDLRSWRK
jgi:hypothetical protein